MNHHDEQSPAFTADLVHSAAPADGIGTLTARNRARVDGPGPLPHKPTLRVCVVTCMDCRLDIYAQLGLQPADAHVVRNAGGRGRDALRSIVVSQRKLGTREVMLIAHSGCGMATFESDTLAAELGPDAEGVDFLTFTDTDTMVAGDVAWLSEHPLIAPGSVVRGFVMDVETGALREVPRREPAPRTRSSVEVPAG